MIEPLSITVEVHCSVEHAFTVWTSRFGTWWPRSHTVSGADDAEVFLEPELGGRIYERTPDGLEVNWGEITHWDPPRQLGYLWHIRADRTDATDVMISFTPLGDVTRVDIVHSGWERLGDRGPAWRERNQGGWSGLLPHFVQACV